LGFALKDVNKSFEYNNYVLVYNLRLKGWVVFTGIQAESMAIITNSDGSSTFYFGDKDGNIFEFDSENVGYTDNGESIKYLWLFKHTWSPTENFSTTKVRLKYRSLNDITIKVVGTDTMNDEEIVETDHDLPAYTPGGIFEPDKFYQEDVFNNYGYAEEKLDIYSFGRDFFLRITNEEPGTNLAIHEISIEGNVRGAT
jgi:hypothetical protein